MNTLRQGRVGALVLALSSAEAEAYGVSHHGGILLDCEAPIFFDESPAKDARGHSFQTFSVVASNNTDPETIKVWIDNQPLEPKISRQRSGRLLIEGALIAPITQGKVWLKTTAYSMDGCDPLHNWNVFVSP